MFHTVFVGRIGFMSLDLFGPGKYTLFRNVHPYCVSCLCLIIPVTITPWHPVAQCEGLSKLAEKTTTIYGSRTDSLCIGLSMNTGNQRSLLLRVPQILRLNL